MNRALEAIVLVRESYISSMRVQLLYPKLRDQTIKNLANMGISPKDLGINIEEYFDEAEESSTKDKDQSPKKKRFGKNNNSKGQSPSAKESIELRHRKSSGNIRGSFYKKGNIIRPMQDGNKRIKRRILKLSKSK